MYTISRAAERVGISAATLRAWERRYSVVRPQRTDGAYRVYSDDDVRVLLAMKQLVDAGWSAGFAAEEAVRQMGGRPANSARTLDAAAESEPTLTEHGSAESLGHGLSAKFVAAAATLDAARLDEVLDQMFSMGGFETVAGTFVFPALEALGQAWESGRVTVAGEHLASHAVGRRLAAAYDAAGSTGSGARILVGLAPGSRHELGILAFAAVARRHGLRADYLGADVPVADWLTASGEPGVAAVVMAIRAPTDAAPMARVAAAVHRHHPGLLIAVGGAEQAKAPSGVLRLGDDFAEAARTLATAVAV
ncbi:MAG TPA: MerR family transcriptional regulator [Aeromicrobium sp.]|nr:MerR family transcriptional regulator [Aeromicrobium sp.]